MTQHLYLCVPYAERALARDLGAIWCRQARRWYCTATRHRTRAFRRWHNKSLWRRVAIHPDSTKAGIQAAKKHDCMFDPAAKSWYIEVTDDDALTPWHKARLTPPPVTRLAIAFAERETAKAHGARWDGELRTWVIRSRAKLSPWLLAHVTTASVV